MGRRKLAQNFRGRSNTKSLSEVANPSPPTFVRPSGRTLTWDNYLKSLHNLPKIPPVNMFKHAPGAAIWDAVAIPNIVIELRNPFTQCQTDIYWVGTVVYFAGYFALVKFERFGTEPNQLSWISFYSNVPHPIGWCKQNGKILHPGKATAKAHPDYNEKLKIFLDGKQTISPYHVELFTNDISSMVSLNPTLPVEVEDISDPTSNKLGRISVISGDRFHVHYLTTSGDDAEGVWFSNKCEAVHPLGWSESVGNYLDITHSCGIKFEKLSTDNFPNFPPEMIITAGMCLETRHPSFPHRIVGAVIVKVLQMGYFIGKTCDKLPDTRMEFRCHVTSPFIYPVGWGLKWGIDVENHMAGSMWDREYLQLERLPQRPPHYFEVGMVLEAMDITQASFCGPVTIIKVAEHMLFIHFNHWSRQVHSNSMWVDAECGDIYPIGYSELIGIEFQGHV
ncbi:unnamed protein product [Allacma fusca]|uniref:Uncharacterized protein n=1 Tax=Allacma fusca TaxID=39272 RepID=A0A8J2MGU7_9HEXA|nr:unnamed protein product [Allacma fusca]